MINVPSPQLASIKSHPAPLLNIPQNVQYHIQGCKNRISDLKVEIKTSQFKIINVKKTEFPKYKQTLEWRKKTQFPIVKVKNWKVLSEKMYDSEINLEVLIELESSFISLEDFQKISFIHSIYILKEALIGFERLCYHFGSFRVESSMIKFNETGFCKVWVNRDSFTNQITFGQIKCEKDFIFEICQIIKRKVTKYTSAKQLLVFFENIQSCRYFFEAMGAIDEFTKQNIIYVPGSLHNVAECKSPLLKKYLNLNLIQQQKKQNLAVSSAVPTFLKKNQVKKKNSDQTPILSEKKFLAVQKKGLFDRSLTDVNIKLSSFMASRKQSTQYQNLQIQKQNQNQFFEQGNQFLQNLKIRLLQTNEKKEDMTHSAEIVSEFKLTLENNPERYKDVMGQVSDLDSSEYHKSRFSLHQQKRKQVQNFNESSSNIAVKISKPKRLNGFFLQNHSNFPLKTNYSKKIKLETQIQEDFECSEDNPSKLCKKLKEKRKYSGDIDKFSGLKDQKVVQNKFKKYPQFLNVRKICKNKSFLTKSPSHQVISFSQKHIEYDNDERDAIFLRGTLMINSDWKLSLKKSDQNKQKYHLPDTKQTLRQEEIKNIQTKKLTTLGRQIDESSDTENLEFELEYGRKMQKERFIRNQILNILN